MQPFSKSKPTRVALFDNSQTTLDGLRFRIGGSTKLQVVAIGSYANEIEKVLQKRTVDVLVIEINLPASVENQSPFPFLTVIPTILDRHSELNILVISEYDKSSLIKAVIDTGVSGYILKTDLDSLRNISDILQTVSNGGIYFSQGAYLAVNNLQKEVGLSQRQWELLLLCSKYPNSTTSDLAEKMKVANSTIRNLLSDIYSKLGTTNRETTVSKAVHFGLIPASNPSSPNVYPTMAGDSTTDAPPPDVHKKKKKGK